MRESAIPDNPRVAEGMDFMAKPIAAEAPAGEIKGRLNQFFSTWVFHLFLSCAVILLVFWHPPMIFSGDTDTARNYLNTIVSSLSTILALCISIILVAIQLAASNYTHRVLDFYVRLPYNASLFLLYLVTIMHSFVLMAKIRDPLNDPLPQSLRPEMSADLVLVIICFVSLLIYMYAVIQLLKPERMIHLVMRDYQRAYRKGHWRRALANVEQICDIAKRAAAVSDSSTGIHCLEVMLAIGKELPHPSERADDPFLKLHESLIDQWVEMIGVAAKEQETGLMQGPLEALSEQGRRYIAARSWPAAVLIIKAYRHIVFSHLLAEGQVFYIEQVAHQLYALAFVAVDADERGRAFTLRTWDVIRNIGERIWSTESAGAALFLDSFLMPDDLDRTLVELVHKNEQTDAVVLYFRLWKVFLASAAKRDIARWGHWWESAITDKAVMEDGEGIAWLLAAQAGEMHARQTLEYVWGWQGQSRPQLPPEYQERRLELFDGWPLSGISADPEERA